MVGTLIIRSVLVCRMGRFGIKVTWLVDSMNAIWYAIRGKGSKLFIYRWFGARVQSR